DSSAGCTAEPIARPLIGRVIGKFGAERERETRRRLLALEPDERREDAVLIVAAVDAFGRRRERLAIAGVDRVGVQTREQHFGAVVIGAEAVDGLEKRSGHRRLDAE